MIHACATYVKSSVPYHINRREINVILGDFHSFPTIIVSQLRPDLFRRTEVFNKTLKTERRKAGIEPWDGTGCTKCG